MIEHKARQFDQAATVNDISFRYAGCFIQYLSSSECTLAH